LVSAQNNKLFPISLCKINNLINSMTDFFGVLKSINSPEHGHPMIQILSLRLYLHFFLQPLTCRPAKRTRSSHGLRAFQCLGLLAVGTAFCAEGQPSRRPQLSGHWQAIEPIDLPALKALHKTSGLLLVANQAPGTQPSENQNNYQAHSKAIQLFPAIHRKAKIYFIRKTRRRLNLTLVAWLDARQKANSVLLLGQSFQDTSTKTSAIRQHLDKTFFWTTSLIKSMPATPLAAKSFLQTKVPWAPTNQDQLGMVGTARNAPALNFFQEKGQAPFKPNHGVNRADSLADNMATNMPASMPANLEDIPGHNPPRHVERHPDAQNALVFQENPIIYHDPGLNSVIPGSPVPVAPASRPPAPAPLIPVPVPLIPAHAPFIPVPVPLIPAPVAPAPGSPASRPPAPAPLIPMPVAPASRPPAYRPPEHAPFVPVPVPLIPEHAPFVPAPASRMVLADNAGAFAVCDSQSQPMQARANQSPIVLPHLMPIADPAVGALAQEHLAQENLDEAKSDQSIGQENIIEERKAEELDPHSQNNNPNRSQEDEEPREELEEEKAPDEANPPSDVQSVAPLVEMNEEPREELEEEKAPDEANPQSDVQSVAPLVEMNEEPREELEEEKAPDASMDEVPADKDRIQANRLNRRSRIENAPRRLHECDMSTAPSENSSDHEDDHPIGGSQESNLQETLPNWPPILLFDLDRVNNSAAQEAQEAQEGQQRPQRRLSHFERGDPFAVLAEPIDEERKSQIYSGQLHSGQIPSGGSLSDQDLRNDESCGENLTALDGRSEHFENQALDRNSASNIDSNRIINNFGDNFVNSFGDSFRNRPNNHSQEIPVENSILRAIEDPVSQSPGPNFCEQDLSPPAAGEQENDARSHEGSHEEEKNPNRSMRRIDSEEKNQNTKVSPIIIEENKSPAARKPSTANSAQGLQEKDMPTGQNQPPLIAQHQQEHRQDGNCAHRGIDQAPPCPSIFQETAPQQVPFAPFPDPNQHQQDRPECMENGASANLDDQSFRLRNNQNQMDSTHPILSAPLGQQSPLQDISNRDPKPYDQPPGQPSGKSSGNKEPTSTKGPAKTKSIRKNSLPSGLHNQDLPSLAAMGKQEGYPEPRCPHNELARAGQNPPQRRRTGQNLPHNEQDRRLFGNITGLARKNQRPRLPVDDQNDPFFEALGQDCQEAQNHPFQDDDQDSGACELGRWAGKLWDWSANGVKTVCGVLARCSNNQTHQENYP
jgi:hypothetical protein